MKRHGMPGFKIRIDLIMPEPPQKKKKSDDDECEVCGLIHEEDDCKGFDGPMRNGPIPELLKGEPVVKFDEEDDNEDK